MSLGLHFNVQCSEQIFYYSNLEERGLARELKSSSAWQEIFRPRRDHYHVHKTLPKWSLPWAQTVTSCLYEMRLNIIFLHSLRPIKRSLPLNFLTENAYIFFIYFMYATYPAHLNLPLWFHQLNTILMAFVTKLMNKVHVKFHGLRF
jgi:hypothetical protein